ncbi:hypothetical protein B0H13DRAFT_2107442 [Mycena leptocephala]|nr:hypothetical protein B0H13DRAFT_2107442 [Mycena leptocephala]
MPVLMTRLTSAPSALVQSIGAVSAMKDEIGCASLSCSLCILQLSSIHDSVSSKIRPRRRIRFLASPCPERDASQCISFLDRCIPLYSPSNCADRKLRLHPYLVLREHNGRLTSRPSRLSRSVVVSYSPRHLRSSPSVISNFEVDGHHHYPQVFPCQRGFFSLYDYKFNHQCGTWTFYYLDSIRR